MKKVISILALIAVCITGRAQKDATIREYKKNFRTYPFSDPDPVPEMSKIYPYFRYDGYTDKPVDKEWKVVELENDFIRVMVLPEIGGKIWAAIEKSSDKSFIYYNHVVKFRDVAMRGPWTSGGLEPNYGIVGHTPNCATPVDYTIIKRKDGSVSCVVGVLDLLTRSVWRVDINLQKDKAYFTTNSTWYNSSPFEQPYYHWMNGALRAADDLEFVFPGNKYIGHAGEYSSWPVDDKGRNLSFYRNNNFGSYKSYHVFGKLTNFWGAYYHNEDFGMARYSTYDDKAGKKIWIWGLSREGMIWEKLLSDNDGQYVEVQSGRLFNQPAEESSYTPFKNRGFAPHATDKWTEYWFPVKNTQGLLSASNYGSLNVKAEGGSLKIYLLPVQNVQDTLKVFADGRQVYSKAVELKTMQLFADSIKYGGTTANVKVELGDQKLSYDAQPDANVLSRPYTTPANFDWNSVQGLHIQGKEFIRERMYTPAEEKLKAALAKDSNYLPALADYALLMYRQMKYTEGLYIAKRALSIDAYHPESNYYYALLNEQLKNSVDAKDGYDIASQSVEFRSAAYTRLAMLHLEENAIEKAIQYASRSIAANASAIDAYQVLAVIYRHQAQKEMAEKILDTLQEIDPLNHFANFERYLLGPSETTKQAFTGMIRNEMPEQTFLELASWYYNLGRKQDALKVLELSKPNAEVIYWKAYLGNTAIDTTSLQPGVAFPFRHETSEILQQLISKQQNWLLKYHLALIKWNNNDIEAARELLESCGNEPAYAPFYSVRAKIRAVSDSAKQLTDLEKARELDGNQWRYGRALVNYFLAHEQIAQARTLAASEYRRYPENYIMGMLYARVLMKAKDYNGANKILSALSVLPNEGATAGRVLYRDVKLMLAAQQIKSKNYKKALVYISESKDWPERLGSGKPYEEDVDERVQDWLTYQVQLKMKDQAAAQQTLSRINTYTKSVNAGRQPSLADYISVMALKKSGRGQEASALLKAKADKHPSNEMLNWIEQQFEGKNAEVPAKVKEDDTYLLLSEAEAL